MTYGLSFAAISAVIVHTALFHGQEIWFRFRQARSDELDVHARMMRKYAPVPLWWYLALFLVFFALSLVTILVWETHLTWWALIIAVLISAVWIVPIGVIQAVTNIQLGLNVFTEFIIGYMLPGRPVAMMLFKTYGYITMVQGLYFLQDLKLGQYMKVPFRVLFWGQAAATIWSCFVQVAVLHWGITNISDVCTNDQVNNFTCPNGRVFFNASVIWGLIGPQRIFSPGALYSGLLFFWLVGVLTPIAIYIGARMFPKSSIRYLSAPIIFGGTGNLPPATPLNYVSILPQTLSITQKRRLIYFHSFHGPLSASSSTNGSRTATAAGGCVTTTSPPLVSTLVWPSAPSSSLPPSTSPTRHLRFGGATRRQRTRWTRWARPSRRLCRLEATSGQTTGRGWKCLMLLLLL